MLNISSFKVFMWYSWTCLASRCHLQVNTFPYSWQLLWFSYLVTSNMLISQENSTCWSRRIYQEIQVANVSMHGVCLTERYNSAQCWRMWRYCLPSTSCRTIIYPQWWNHIQLAISQLDLIAVSSAQTGLIKFTTKPQQCLLYYS